MLKIKKDNQERNIGVHNENDTVLFGRRHRWDWISSEPWLWYQSIQDQVCWASSQEGGIGLQLQSWSLKFDRKDEKRKTDFDQNTQTVFWNVFEWH